MSVKSTVFVLCLIGAHSHPINPHSSHHNDHFASNFPTNYPINPTMDQMNTLILKNFDHSPLLGHSHVSFHQQDEPLHLKSDMHQFPINYAGLPEPHTTFGGHVHGIGRPPQIPHDVEIIPAHIPAKPSIPFGPNFQDVELVWPGSGKPIFPREHDMTGSTEIMEKEDLSSKKEYSQMPMMVREETPQHFVHLVDDRDGSPIIRSRPNTMPMIIESKMTHRMREVARPMMLTERGNIMEMPREMHSMEPMMVVERGNMEMPREAHNSDVEMGPVMLVERHSMEMPRELHGLREEMRPIMIIDRNTNMDPRENYNQQEMAPVMIEKELPQMIPTDRVKRQHIQMLKEDLPLMNSINSRNEIENELEGRIEQMVDNNSNDFNQTPIMGMMNDDSSGKYEPSESTSIVTEQSLNDKYAVSNDQPIKLHVTQTPLSTMSVLDSKNEIKHEETATIDETLNDEQFTPDQLPTEDLHPTNDKVKEPSSTPMSLFDTQNEVKNPDLAAVDKTQNDQPIKTDQVPADANLNTDKVNEESSTMSLFDSKNEIKNKDLAAIDKTQNDQPLETDQTSEEASPTIDKIMEESSTMSLFDSKNEIKNKDLAAIDKTQNDQPLKTDQTLEEVSPTNSKVIVESSTMSLFDTKNEIKNKDLAAIDKTQNDQQLSSTDVYSTTTKPTQPFSTLTIEEKLRELALLEELLWNQQRRLENLPVDVIDKLGQAYVRDNPYKDISEADKNKDLATIIDEKYESLEKALYALSNPSRPLPNSQGRSVENKQIDTPFYIAIDHNPSPQYINGGIDDLARVVSGLNQDISNVPSGLKSNPQSILLYPQHNQMNYQAQHESQYSIPSAGISPDYFPHYVYQNYQVTY